MESGLAWYSEDKALQKADSGAYDTGSLKTESSSKYRKSRPSEGAAQEKTARRELKKPQSLGHPGSFKKGQNPPVGVTSPITHTSQSVLKVAGKEKEYISSYSASGVPLVLQLHAIINIHDPKICAQTSIYNLCIIIMHKHVHTHLHHFCIPFRHFFLTTPLP